jgi:hypothetical protein
MQNDYEKNAAHSSGDDRASSSSPAGSSSRPRVCLQLRLFYSFISPKYIEEMVSSIHNVFSRPVSFSEHNRRYFRARA